MTTSIGRAAIVVAALALSGTPSNAKAQTVPGSTLEPSGDKLLFSGDAVDEALLARTAGRENQATWQSASPASNARSENNKVGDNSPTGALGVSDSAFQNVSGISMVNLNTGNASAINATLNVNLTITMAPPAAGGM